MLNKKGFSLIEILLSISILTIIMVMGSDFIIKSFKSTRFVSEQEEAVSHARRAMGIMIKELRGANISQKGDYPLLRINDDDLIFYSDIDSDGIKEKIQYVADTDNNLLIKKVTEPDASGDYTNIGASTTISKYLNNHEDDIFTYFDSNNNQTTVINDVRMIHIKLKINVTPTIMPNDYVLEGNVVIRNLKSN